MEYDPPQNDPNRKFPLQKQRLKYRFICLLSHASKVVSVCLLRRLVADTDWTGTCRYTKPASDSTVVPATTYIYIVAQIMDSMLERGEQLISVFIDYVAAFDSVSHKFTDTALS
jgi:hypothetical protein